MRQMRPTPANVKEGCCTDILGSTQIKFDVKVEGGQGNRLKGSVSGEPRCRLCALITLRAVDSDLEFAAPRDADLPDEGRAYVEHVTTPTVGQVHIN